MWTYNGNALLTSSYKDLKKRKNFENFSEVEKLQNNFWRNFLEKQKNN